MSLHKKAIAVIFLLFCLPHHSAAYDQGIPDHNPAPKYTYQTELLVTLGVASAWALTSSSVESDKKKHFAVSALFGAMSESALRHLDSPVHDRSLRLALATGLGTLPGIAKELSDSRFDNGDLLADVIGSFTGALASDLIQGPGNYHLKFSASSTETLLVWSIPY